jgi:DNA-binding transcriptional ArsR family regulator
VSALPLADDPWADISKERKLQDGTKELILNAVFRSPRTIAQLAEELNLSQPTVHRHVTELYTSELIREVTVPDEHRQSSVERYYAPNFPIIFASDRHELFSILNTMARGVADVFLRRQSDLAEAFSQTSLPVRGENFDQLLHWMYTEVVRIARERLQEQGVLPAWPEHEDGSRWLWWAEELLDNEMSRTGQGT